MMIASSFCSMYHIKARVGVADFKVYLEDIPGLNILKY